MFRSSNKRVAFFLPAIFLLTVAIGLAASETAAAPVAKPLTAPGSPVYGWAALGSGINGTVFAVGVDGYENLYAGGQFTSAGGVSANRVAMWDGSAWRALGVGTNNDVLAIAVDGSGNLYVGGSFTSAGGVPANYIAMWDGSTWNALGSGTNGSVSALAVDRSGNLYAGGGFTSAGGVPANKIAMWDGSTWNALGPGMDSFVITLAVAGSGDLYAGGDFTSAGGVSADGIAMWNGSSWSAVGDGSSMDVHTLQALAVDGSGNLYASGVFAFGGSMLNEYVAMWDGSVWSALGSQMDGRVFALAPDGSGNLYVCGIFTKAGGVSASRVAMWDGSHWNAMGEGIDLPVYTLALDGSGNLYVGGQITNAGGVITKGIALYGQAPEVILNGISSLPDTGDGRLDEGEIVTVGLNMLTVTFSEDLQDMPGGSYGSDVTRWANYSLVKDGTTSLSIEGVFYENNGGAGPFVATVVVNGGSPVPSGNYTFTVNGSTSVVDDTGIRLAGDGLTSGTNFVRNFSVVVEEGGVTPATLPATGFAPGQLTVLPNLTAPYNDLGSLWMEIPRLGLEMPIVGVPGEGNTWDVTWLGSDAGWLEGTAYPAFPGNSVLTGHVWNADNTPGPFANLKELHYGDTVLIHIGRSVYAYEVRENRLVEPDDFSVLGHEEYDWITLLTCQGFDEREGDYTLRRVVRAVRVSSSRD
jgi:LPXTG-site transpeptidase (sortase) family protein